MIKHIILWNLKDEFSKSEKAKLKIQIKEGLEGLSGQIEGLNEIKVNIDPLETSTADLMLCAVLKDEAALKLYANHPKHLEVANGIIRPNVKLRVCFDFEEK